MRLIGTLTDGTLAQRFCDYLVTLSIDAVADYDGDPPSAAWNVWVRDESDVAKARQEFAEFERRPDAGRYQVDAKAEQIRDARIAAHQQQVKQQRGGSPAASRRSPGGRTRLGSEPRQQRMPVTIAIIVLAVIATLLTNFGDPKGEGRIDSLTFQEQTYFALSFVDARDYQPHQDAFASLRKGQLWRLITPLLMHGDEFHLAFNMLWVFFFGTAIERIHGSWFFLLLTLLTQTAGMMLQVLLPTADFMPEFLRGSPFAIGASGAVYGMFGYLWIRSTLDSSYPIFLDPMNVALLLGWLVLCMTPLIPKVANGAHIGGLLAGILIAVTAHAVKR